MNQNNWKWFGFPGHFCLRDECRFHLTTLVGPYLVSTLGAMIKRENPTEMVALASSPDCFFETIVFFAREEQCECGCGLPDIGNEIDSERYKTAENATKGHMKLCTKYDSDSTKETDDAKRYRCIKKYVEHKGILDWELNLSLRGRSFDWAVDHLDETGEILC